MNVTIKGKNKNIAIVEHESLLITDLQSAVDFAMTIGYETRVYNLVIPKKCIIEDFFNLSTKLAGEILQKYMNYGVKFAVFGDFSHYTSKPLHDFIYESNNGRNFFFVDTESEAIKKIEKSYEIKREKSNHGETRMDFLPDL